MPSRSVRRRHHKRLQRADAYAGLSAAERWREANRKLIGWRGEARYRARHLGVAAAWALAADPEIQAVARALDPSGELESELRRACAEAVAEAAGWHLVAGSRPLADRSRLQVDA
jgi:hypothetical protein